MLHADADSSLRFGLLQEEHRTGKQKMLQAQTKQDSMQEHLSSNLLKRKEELEAQIATANHATDA